jgi:transcriptional regulator with XRE-family HTH domain
MEQGANTGTAPTWGEGIKILRHLRDWTQADLAERSRVPQSSISDIESGRRRASDSARVRIAKAFGVDPHALFPYIDDESQAS